MVSLWKKIDPVPVLKMLAACMLASLLAACSLLPAEEPPLAPPLVEPVKQNIVTVEVRRGTLEQTVRGSGVLEPYDLRYHSFKAGGGRIKEVFVRRGQEVKAGDPLVQLELEGLDLELKYKALNLEKAKLELEQAKANMNPDEMRVKLIQLDIAQAEYDLVKERLDNKLLKAERDGVVTFVTNKEPPDMVNAYETLVVVADTSKLHVILTKNDSNWASAVKVGMDAVLAWRGQTFAGKVVQTPGSAPSTDDTRLLELYARSVYIEPETLPEGVNMGDVVDVTIVTDRRENTLVIPANALRTFASRNYVQVMDGERVFEADVEIGIRTASELEILSGVEEGQQIILR